MTGTTQEAETLQVPQLRSGGIILGYQCNLGCRHCNYNCGPDAGGWMSEDTLDQVLDALSRERRLLDIHLAGGEPTLNPGLLVMAIRKALDKKLRLSYVETNGHFAHSMDSARSMLRPLKQAGLNSLLVSVSPYHNEAVPLRHTLNCLHAAVEIFGEDSVFPWLGHFIPMLAKMDPEIPHTLEDFFAANAMDPKDGSLLRLFPLSPGGRVPYGLRDLFTLQPADDFRGGHCLEILTATDHFHIDPEGSLFTGHCPGIASGRLADLHGEKNLDDHPVFITNALGGPHALMETARRIYDFVPDVAGYVSPCHLCLEVRAFLHGRDADRWAELAPASYYRTMPAREGGIG